MGKQGVVSPFSVTLPEIQSMCGLWVVNQGCPRMTFSSCPIWVVKKSCSSHLLSIWRTSRILCLIKPPVLLVPSAFLAGVGYQSFFSGHFILLVKSMLTQQIMALLSMRARVLALSPPSIGWRVIGMVIPHLVVVVLISGDESEKVSPFDSLAVSPRYP